MSYIDRDTLQSVFALTEEQYEFQDTLAHLLKVLPFCYMEKSGRPVWYEGTPELLLKMMRYLGQNGHGDTEYERGEWKKGM